VLTVTPQLTAAAPLTQLASQDAKNLFELASDLTHDLLRL
jgi:hypothetical protein